MSEQKIRLYISFGHIIVSICTIGAATTLSALGKLDPSAVTGIFGAAIGLAGGVVLRANGNGRKGD